MSKTVFKDKINGNELDLSLNELTEVPVKELVVYPKATQLDLSCNHIQSLPNTFASLTHLVKIDLSQNQLSQLPHNFGNLYNLQYLDLYRNELTFLPISFCRLKNLRWLDLKDNPLDPKLKVVAGDCLDEKQCQLCAKKVVSFMQAVESDLEREKQKKLKEERERETALKAQEEKALEMLRKQKKAEREKRKAEIKAKKEEHQKHLHEETKFRNSGSNRKNGSLKSDATNQEKPGFHWITVFLLLLTMPLLFFSLLLSFHIYLGHTIQSFDDIQSAVKETGLQLRDILIVWWHAFLVPYSLCVKDSLTKLLHSSSLFNASSVL